MNLSEMVFTNLLALDSYYKGYSTDSAGFPPGFPTGQIGNATLLIDYATETAVAEGFYAAAYRIDGVTVISYRGTDDLTLELAYTDIPIAAGQWQDDSVLLAMH